MIIKSKWHELVLTTKRMRICSFSIAVIVCALIICVYSINSNLMENYSKVMQSMPAFLFAIAGFIFGFRGNILDGVSKKARLDYDSLRRFNKFMQEIIVTSCLLAILSLILMPILCNSVVFLFMIFSSVYITLIVFFVSIYAYYVYDEAYKK